MEAARRRFVVIAMAALLAAPLLSGCLSVVTGTVLIAASSPKAASGMTLFVAEQPGFSDRLREESVATYRIYYGDKLVYPSGTSGATLRVQDKTGSAFVPYNLFVVGNGQYDVVVTHDGDDYRTRVEIRKWANYVFLHPFDKGSVIRVEAALQSATGGSAESRILASGELLVEIVYRGLDGEDYRSLGLVRAATEHDQTGTRIDVPRGRLSYGPGYYSFEPVFHNGEARNNVQVKADPTMANRDPPWNWIQITT